MKTDLFQSCGHCWVFQICWHIECSIFTALPFRIWDCSPGIPSPPLALFIVMVPKAHLTSLSRISGSRWVITPLWLSGHEDLFCTVLLCILATSSYYLLLLLGPYHFCPRILTLPLFSASRAAEQWQTLLPAWVMYLGRGLKRVPNYCWNGARPCSPCPPHVLHLPFVCGKTLVKK